MRLSFYPGIGDVTRDLHGTIGHTLNVGLTLSVQDKILMELTVIDAAQITIVAGPLISIGGISLNANFVISLVTLPSSVPTQIPQIFLQTVPHHPRAKTKIGSLILQPLIISQEISLIYLFILNMMALTKYFFVMVQVW
jgi:hypothetical protein